MKNKIFSLLLIIALLFPAMFLFTNYCHQGNCFEIKCNVCEALNTVKQNMNYTIFVFRVILSIGLLSTVITYIYQVKIKESSLVSNKIRIDI